MSFLGDWIGKTIGLTDGKFWSTYFGGRNSSGKPVSRDTVLTIAAAWACVRIISEVVGILPNFLYRKLPDGSREIVTGHPLYSILHDAPNPDFAACEFWEAVAACLCLEGNAYGMKMKLRSGGAIVGIDLIDPRTVMVTRQPRSWELRYRFNLRNQSYDLTSEDMIHWRGFGNGADLGLSPIRYGANTFGVAMAADDAAGATFRNSNNSSGFIQTPTVLKPDQRKQFNESLDKFKGDENAGKLMLLEGGFEFKGFGINPDDLQMLEARGFSIEQVCSFFRVPPFMIGHQEKSTSWGTGLEQTVLAFLTFTMLPYLKKIQSRNNLALLSADDRAKGLYSEFSVDALLQADSAARAAFYSTMTQNGLMTRDDARVKENLPRKGGNADVLTVQSALVPLDMLGTAAAGPPAQAVRNALRDFLGMNDDPPASTQKPAE